MVLVHLPPQCRTIVLPTVQYTLPKMQVPCVKLSMQLLSVINIVVFRSAVYLSINYIWSIQSKCSWLQKKVLLGLCHTQSWHLRMGACSGIRRQKPGDTFSCCFGPENQNRFTVYIQDRISPWHQIKKNWKSRIYGPRGSTGCGSADCLRLLGLLLATAEMLSPSPVFGAWAPAKETSRQNFKNKPALLWQVFKFLLMLSDSLPKILECLQVLYIWRAGIGE